VSQQQIIVVSGGSGPGILVRAIWFIFIGWWLGLLWSALAWFLNLTIIGLPVGLIMINKLPAVMTLKPATQTLRVTQQGETTIVSQEQQEQRPFLVRAAFFVLVGWWFSGLWMVLAYCLVILLITIPLAFWMYDRVPAVTTLRRY
jgi:uncharacterized membrane protein YccF (DUF307 family)